VIHGPGILDAQLARQGSILSESTNSVNTKCQ
jgi:hypothetical protein